MRILFGLFRKNNAEAQNIIKPDVEFMTSLRTIQGQLFGVQSGIEKLIAFEGTEAEFEKLTSSLLMDLSYANYSAGVYAQRFELKLRGVIK